ncbi:hypothetical protein SteCoe_31839 [Stentor coeruleus]|uniref:Acyltransferase 3 domain-containing protein n=1 Tax=Stentor coeruleus TaxID=5963 RepID=A0A1R2B0E6_9CILI|nr:hypothetical protein SteCoe_31839 [Stentor coeruleus]
MVLNKILFLLIGGVLGYGNLTECVDEIKKVILNAPGAFSASPNSYAKMFSYSGKSINQLGRFEDCYSLEKARYMLIELSKSPPLLLSICGPDVCSKSNYYEIINSIINTTVTEESTQLSKFFGLKSSNANQANISYSIIFPESYIHSRFHELNGGAIAMVLITVIIGTISIIGTIIDINIKHEEENIRLDVEQTGIGKDDYLSVPQGESTIINILICFSIIRNMKKLMSVHLDDYHPHLYFFDGIRVITIAWVILGTIGGLYLYDLPLANYMKLEQISKKYYTLPVYTSLLALDVLFWIGGVLYTYFLLNSYSASPKHWLLIYLKHYLEMVPMFIFITFFFWTLSRYMGAGPYWYTGNDAYSDCKDYWYANLFFLSNFIPNGTWSKCLSHGWFLSVEMQFFFFTPILIWIYKKSPGCGWFFIAGLAGLGTILGGVVAHHFDLNVSIYGPHHWAFYNYYNNKPYIRMPPYVLGIATGFIYFTSATNNDDKISSLIIKLMKNTIYRFANLFLGISLWLIIINVQFQVYKHPGDDFSYNEWSLGKTSAYFAFLRILLGISYMMMFTPMVLGYFSGITSVLSSSIWTPFSRLTFSVYLIQAPLADIFMRSLQYPKYFSKTSLFCDWFSMMVICYFFAFIFAVFIDIPVKTFILWIFGKKTTKENYYEIND